MQILIILLSTFILFFMKTLTTLSLGYNRIGDQGTKALAKALENHTVSNFGFTLRNSLFRWIHSL
jgi:hypothetical protein